jgi:hypothetical protein
MPSTGSVPANARALHMSAEAEMNVVFISWMLRGLCPDLQIDGRPIAAKAT